MNSENISNSTLESDELQAEPKARNRAKAIIVAICLVVIGVVITGFVMHQNKMNSIRAEYYEFCNLYNGTVDSYNSVVTNYNTLLDIISKEESENASEKVSLLTYYEENFEQFYDDGAEQSLLNEELNKVSTESARMTDLYNELCLSTYNNAVEDYNVLAEKYNALIERLGAYKIPNMLTRESLKKPVTENYGTYLEKWANVNVFYGEIENISVDIDKLNGQYYDACLMAYNSVVSDYNIVAEAYKAILEETSVHFIEGMQRNVELKEVHNTTEEWELDEEELCFSLDEIILQTDTLIADYLIAKQITNPTEEWILERLKDVDSITGIQAVTKSNDPNGLLGKEGGYTSCVYFTIKDIALASVRGNGIVEKGTDVGGAIEVYSNLEYALNRCDYLSQFDGTLLYSGSYAIVGTMVIRTSYKLDNNEQVALTNEITKALTTIK